MKFLKIKNKDLDTKIILTIKYIIVISIFSLLAFSCSDDEGCGYEIGEIEYPVISLCPGFIQNGDFEVITGDPNTTTDQDIDLATNWGALWQTGSLADLFDSSTTWFGSGTFLAPTPNSGVFSGMWILNSLTSNQVYREGMFNQLTTPILSNTGSYNLNFDYAKMSTAASGDVTIGIYGIHYSSGVLPPNPTSSSVPSNLDLFGSSSTVLLADIVVGSSSTNSWANANVVFDTNSITMPAGGITHIMITGSHNFSPDEFRLMYMAFDNYCLTN